MWQKGVIKIRNLPGFDPNLDGKEIWVLGQPRLFCNAETGDLARCFEVNVSPIDGPKVILLASIVELLPVFAENVVYVTREELFNNETK